MVRNAHSITQRCVSDDSVHHESELTFYADQLCIDRHNTLRQNFDGCTLS